MEQKFIEASEKVVAEGACRAITCDRCVFFCYYNGHEKPCNKLKGKLNTGVGCDSSECVDAHRRVVSGEIDFVDGKLEYVGESEETTLEEIAKKNRESLTWGWGWDDNPQYAKKAALLSVGLSEDYPALCLLADGDCERLKHFSLTNPADPMIEITPKAATMLLVAEEFEVEVEFLTNEELWRADVLVGVDSTSAIVSVPFASRKHLYAKCRVKKSLLERHEIDPGEM